MIFRFVKSHKLVTIFIFCPLISSGDFYFFDLRFFRRMFPSAFPSLTLKTLLCAATCFVLPSLSNAQGLVNTSSFSSSQTAQTPVVFLSSGELAQSGSYTVQPVFVDGVSAAPGGGDLASPVYTSIQASDSSQTSDFGDPDFAPMPANANIVGAGAVQTAQSAAGDGSKDPNHGLVTVQMVPVGALVSTTVSQTTEVAANPLGSTQADGFGWRLNTLSSEGFNAPAGVVGDLGAVVGYHPNWDGSAEHMFLALPYADVQLGKRIYLSTDRGFGVNILASKNAAMSVGLDYRFPRMDVDLIAPMQHVSGALTTGGRLNLYVRELELFLNADIGVFGEMSGWDMELGISSVQPITDRVAVKLTAAVSGADAQLLNNMYGVSESDALALNVPEFAFDSFGLKDMRLKAEGKFFFSHHLGIYSAVQVKVLLDQVAESPLVDDLGDAVQLSSNLGLIYRF